MYSEGVYNVNPHEELAKMRDTTEIDAVYKSDATKKVDALMPRATYADPVTFRPKSPEARALLEAVATVRGTSVSKLVAEAAQRFAVEYVQAMGKEEFAKRLAEVEERQRRLQDRFMASLDDTDDESLDDVSPAEDSSFSTATNSHAG